MLEDNVLSQEYKLSSSIQRLKSLRNPYSYKDFERMTFNSEIENDFDNFYFVNSQVIALFNFFIAAIPRSFGF